MSDVFGLPEPGEDVPDFLQETPQEPTQEELYPGLSPAEEKPEEPVAERPRDPATGRFMKQEATPEVAPPPEQPLVDEKSGLDEAETPPPTVYAGKYNDVPALEKGYRELRDLQRRTAERAKAEEQRRMEVEFQARQMEDAVRRATDYVRQLQAREQQVQQQPQYLYDEQGNPVQVPQPQPTYTPEQIQSLVDAQVQQRWGQTAQAMQEQQWRQQQYDEAAAAQAAFLQAHPEVEKNGVLDEDLASTILALNESWASIDGSSFNLGSEESYAIAFEASRRPALRRVLEKQPNLMDDDEGMILARSLASQIDGQQATPQANPQIPRMTPRQNTPVAERGSSPAPQQGSPLDEFDQAVAEYRGINKARGSKVFFGE